jgi:hypothetical protein
MVKGDFGKAKIEEENNAKQEQIHDILFNRDLGWQEIIYDLINTLKKSVNLKKQTSLFQARFFLLQLFY